MSISEQDMMEAKLRSRGNRIKQLEDELEMQQAAWRDLNSEMSAVIKQRDMLREALDDIMRWWDGEDEVSGQFIKARAALKEIDDERA